MINFLQSPNQFNTVKLASVSEDQLARIARFQYRKANSLRLASNWLTNLISSGIAKVKGMTKYVKNAFLKILKVFFVQTPVINLFTKFFQSIAYERLLEKLYEAWKLGSNHRVEGKKQLNRIGFIKEFGSRDGMFFYDDYMSGYDDTATTKDLRVKAINIAKEDIGLRTVTEIIKVAWELLNPIKFFEAFFKSLTMIGKNKIVLPNGKKVAGFLGIFLYQLNFAIPMMISISFPQIFTIKVLGGLALGSLIGYNPKEVLRGNSKAVEKLKKDVSSLFSKQHRKFDDEEIYDKIPQKEVFFQDAKGDLKSVARATEEELKALTESI